jgi:hypothetical protein
VVAQRGDGHAGLVAEHGAEVLLGELGRGVDAARIERGVFGHGAGLERAAAARATRIEAPGVEVGGRARRGRHEAVHRAGVAALAVHDHAGREHEPAGEAVRSQRAQELGGGEIVVADVLG